MTTAGLPDAAREAVGHPGTVRLLLLSNGQGEDAIGVALAEALQALAPVPMRIEAWAMVGRGESYASRGIPLIGPRNTLPSEGFGTLSLRAFVRDARAGWFSVHWRQLRAACARRGAQDFCVAIGDVVPLAAAWLSRTPYALVGSAKSAYYAGGSGFTATERWLLRRAETCYARDARTRAALERRGVPAQYLGNPMMDGITLRQPGTARVGDEASSSAPLVACLPGSRGDREANAVKVLALIAQAADRFERGGIRRFAFALPTAFDLDVMLRLLASGANAFGWQAASTSSPDGHASLRLTHGALCADFAYDALGDILSRARVAIGLAGTANEQAVGAGVPVVTFATDGPQGDAYLRMKMPFFGESAVRVAADAQELADALLRITSVPALHARMAEAGRERMGAPGAARAIAADVVARCMRLSLASGS